MNKKVLALVMSAVMVGISVTPVEASGKSEETLNITTEFVEESQVEVSQQGYLKLTKLNNS